MDFIIMVSALAIDDEPAALKTMQLMIERYVPAITELRLCNNPLEAPAMISSYEPQLVFIDIQMPQLNGFDLLQRLPVIDFDIIFATAYDAYAIQAIRFSALDYLLKPIDADELKQAVARFLQKKEQRESTNASYQNLLANLQAATAKDFKLAISNSDGTQFYDPQQIIRLEGESNYTRFHVTGHRPILVSKTIKEYEDLLLPHGFVRVHKSHLVNKHHIVSIAHEGRLVMQDNVHIEVSRRRKEALMEVLKNGYQRGSF
ncbi:MAG: LytTR family DNA-binding domain-containing protein [Chitinophagaceae bacterium]